MTGEKCPIRIPAPRPWLRTGDLDRPLSPEGFSEDNQPVLQPVFLVLKLEPLALSLCLLISVTLSNPAWASACIFPPRFAFASPGGEQLRADGEELQANNIPLPCLH